LLSFGLFAYLGVAVGGTAARVMAEEPPPPPAPSGPPVVISATSPANAKAEAKSADAKAEAKSADAKRDEAKADDAKADDAKAEPVDDAPSKAAESVATPQPTGSMEAATPSAPVIAESHVDLPAPTLAGREALRFVDGVSKDDKRCRDIDEIAKAAREVPAMVPEVSPTRADKAADKLEACRRKFVWTRAYTIRTARQADRQRYADELPARLKAAHGLAVLVTLRGASDERIRIGGGGLDEAKAKELLDGGMRDELVAFGFTDVAIANMKTSYKEELDVPTDNQLAERELGPKGLDRKISLP
jgi:hypothetical protein